MIKSNIFLLIIFLWILNAFSQDNDSIADLLKQLQDLPDVSIEQIDLELKFKQPIDHFHPGNGTFEQKVYLSHKGKDRPVVLWLEGYESRGNYPQEITKILDANQIIVEHRYFGASIPEPCDWKYLTIEQAAADHHAIVEAFKKIYNGKWINSGISKGGQTTMYHRRFYPNDVDVSVCYVGPLNFSDQEKRVFKFLENVGDPESRAKILEFQKLVLEKKSELMPLFKKYADQKKYTFKIGLGAAYEYCALEYSFAFWQWHNFDGCDIPTSDDAPQTILDHFVAVADPDFFSDQGIARFHAFFYQALTQIGFYTYDIAPFEGLLHTVKQPDYSFSAPEGVELTFDPQSMNDVDQWINDHGNNMIFIYGELDPWTSSAVQLSGKTNALKMVKKGGDHRTRINSFEGAEKEKILSTLGKWLDMEIPGGN